MKQTTHTPNAADATQSAPFRGDHSQAHPGEKTATLTRRVKRQPASLGSSFYHLEPGQRVYITGHAGPTIARCSTIADPKERTGEDYFSVTLDGLKMEEQPQTSAPAMRSEEIQHTPGPWRVTTERTRPHQAFSIRGPQGQAIAETVEDHSTVNAETNARLLAAAPALLAALDNLQANPNDPRAHRQAFDAMKGAR